MEVSKWLLAHKKTSINNDIFLTIPSYITFTKYKYAQPIDFPEPCTITSNK